MRPGCGEPTFGVVPVFACRTYDLIAIGSGPAGQQAALQAAALGKRVAIVERGSVGGASMKTGAVAAQTLRAAILELTGHSGTVYGGTFRSKHEITIDDLFWRTPQVVEHERDAISDRLRRNGVELIEGGASFVDPHTLEVRGSGPALTLCADRIVVAVGCTPVHSPEVEFDGCRVLDAEQITRLRRVPETVTVVGGGRIGLEQASMAAALGVRVTLVDKRSRLLEFIDSELLEALQYHLRGRGVTFRLGEEVVAVQSDEGGALTRLANGEEIASEVVLYAAGRRGATESLDLPAAGLEVDGSGRIIVDTEFRTAVPHIFAAGDVVGLPSFAAGTMEQGRLAALAAFGRAPSSAGAPLPHALYTIPEVAFVGPGERDLTRAGVPWIAGVARYRDLSVGEITGDRSGLLKVLVHAATREVLGVHIFGTAATELVHTGQAAIAGRLTVDDLAETVFSVPSFSDAYRLAALDVADRLSELGDVRASAAA